MKVHLRYCSLFLITIFIVLSTVVYSAKRVSYGRVFSTIKAKVSSIHSIDSKLKNDVFTYKLTNKSMSKKELTYFAESTFGMNVQNLIDEKAFYFVVGERSTLVYSPDSQKISWTLNWNSTDNRKLPSDLECFEISKNFLIKHDLYFPGIEMSSFVDSLGDHKVVYLRRRIDGLLFLGSGTNGQVLVSNEGTVISLIMGLAQFSKHQKVSTCSIEKAYSFLLSGKGTFSNMAQSDRPGPSLNLPELKNVDFVYFTNDLSIDNYIPYYRFVFNQDNDGVQPWGFAPTNLETFRE